jgi:lipoprotein-anchoring transpeptidase ErfK/SrfK
MSARRRPARSWVATDHNSFHDLLPEGKAIRYGVTVGEDAQSWAGVAKIGNMTEWPSWTPTQGEKDRLGPLPNYVEGGPANPMGARAMYLFQGSKDTLFRIHGTNQPEYIGEAISSGCIRMTNEDVIDLYKRVKVGTPVVVLNSHLRMASG